MSERHTDQLPRERLPLHGFDRNIDHVRVAGAATEEFSRAQLTGALFEMTDIDVATAHAHAANAAQPQEAPPARPAISPSSAAAARLATVRA